MNKKKLSLVCMLFLLVIFVSARECLDRVQSGENCTIITPAGMNCSKTYDIINATLNATGGYGNPILVDDGTLETLNYLTGLCYLTINQSTGDYVVVLNEDNTSRVIVVDSYTNEDIITEVDSVEENQATLTAQINTNTSTILSNISTVLNHTTDIKNRLGSGMLDNSTTLWDYLYCATGNFNNINTCLFYRMWVLYSWRTTSGIQT